MKNKKCNVKKYIFIVGIILLIGLLSFFGWKIYEINLDKENDKIVDKEKDNKDSERVVSSATPLLYEVTKEGSDNKIYLFGSIHIADNRAYPMNDKILNAFNNSDYLAVEFDIVAFEKDYKRQIEALSIMVCENGKTLKDYLSEETYNLLINYLKENNTYNKAYELYKPSMSYSLVQNVIGKKVKLDARKGIDNYFLKQAKKKKKKILELETPEFQYNLFEEISSELYDVLISSMIMEEEEAGKELVDLYESWLKGDAKAINKSEEIDEAEVSEEEKYLINEYREFNKKLLDDRNDEMTKKVEEYFDDNKRVFVVVGANHVIGEGGLADHLQKLGYTIEKVEY